MNTIKLKQIIREEIQNVLRESINENDSIKLSYKDKQLIKRFQNWAVDNPTSTDVDFFSAKYKLNSEQRYLLKKVFLSGDFKITAAGPLPSDIKPRIGK